jgi:hypothetical protein
MDRSLLALPLGFASARFSLDTFYSSFFDGIRGLELFGINAVVPGVIVRFRRTYYIRSLPYHKALDGIFGFVDVRRKSQSFRLAIEDGLLCW